MIGLLLSCSLPSGGPSWEPLDVEGLQAALDSPTASEADVLLWLLSADLTAMQGTGTALTQVLSATAPASAVDVERNTGSLSGTTVYLLLACYGTGSQPDFSRGWIEVESPVLSLEALTEPTLGGDLLLTAQGCTQDGSQYDGALIGWYDPEDGDLAAEGGLRVTTPTDDFDLPLRAIFSETWSFIVALDDANTTLSVDLNPASPDTATIRYRSGTLSCTLSPDVACTP